ncbi:protein SOB FIVE-LIKE 1-like [Salvia miltiorrhiza]|uniref:protein SOB FIVE-LIKE 1-like n=1 Tax=Salvia miltiorrhiza TaxID=226208 RepID=UPI0025AC21E5|nr:protein SOB FIVE-LIKE 1-like [Salvia miltiorrhiza]
MDSFKFPQGSDECSSNESGWTAYIGSPHQEADHDDDDDDDRDRSKDGKEHKEKDADSDDSMASDASSAPSGQYGHFNKHLAYGNAKTANQRKHGAKKDQKQGDMKRHAEKIKAAKDKADSATRSRKK